jgi:hypothetical protein
MDSNDRKTQIDIAERIQLKLLERWEQLLDNGTLSASEAATIATTLRQNGWNLDPALLPQGIRDKLTADMPEFDADIGDGELFGEFADA